MILVFFGSSSTKRRFLWKWQADLANGTNHQHCRKFLWNSCLNTDVHSSALQNLNAARIFTSALVEKFLTSQNFTSECEGKISSNIPQKKGEKNWHKEHWPKEIDDNTHYSIVLSSLVLTFLCTTHKKFVFFVLKHWNSSCWSPCVPVLFLVLVCKLCELRFCLV